MGAEGEDAITFGDTWLPKNIKKAVINIAPKEQYGKTREEANIRINELLAQGDEN